jgi:hypothetical protein
MAPISPKRSESRYWLAVSLTTLTCRLCGIAQIAQATQAGVGKEKYSIGFKGRWPYCANSSVPTTCEFDETAKDTVRYIRDTMGVQHASFWYVCHCFVTR